MWFCPSVRCTRAAARLHQVKNRISVELRTDSRLKQTADFILKVQKKTCFLVLLNSFKKLRQVWFDEKFGNFNMVSLFLKVLKLKIKVKSLESETTFNWSCHSPLLFVGQAIQYQGQRDQKKKKKKNSSNCVFFSIFF